MNQGFAPAVHDDIVAHMNDDHADAVLAIARAFGAHPDAATAQLVGITADALTLSVDGDTVTIAVQPPIAPLETVRERLVGITRSARDVLDAAPLAEHWAASPDALRTSYRFAGFAEAVHFMAHCVPDIDALDHHPDWCNTHRRVHVSLTTHTVGRVTALDATLAELLDRHYRETMAQAPSTGSP